jgi:4-amino-4-deoxy-L-arabinose transferase-like glycosyltransferase
MKRGISQSLSGNGPLVLLLGIGGLVRLLLWFSEPAVLWPDSVSYAVFAEKIALQGDFSSYQIFRTPLYPLFLAAFFHFGQTAVTGHIIVLAQQILGLLTGLWLYFLSRQVIGARASFWAALIFLLHPLQLYYEMVIQTEVLFCFLLLSALLSAALWMKNGSGRAAFYTGLLLGLSTLTRPIAQLLPLILIVCALLRFGINRKTLLSSLWLLLPFCLVLTPWLLWNKTQHHYWGLSREIGLNMFHRVIDADQLPPETDSLPPALRRAINKHQGSQQVMYFSVWHELLRSGHSELQADNLMLQAALATLREHPGRYLLNTAKIYLGYFLKPHPSISFCVRHDRSYLCSGRPVPPLPMFPPSTIANPEFLSETILPLFFALSPLLMGLIGGLGALGAVLFCIRRKPATAAFIVGPILYFSLLTAIFNREEDRFRLPIEPLLIVCICGALSTQKEQE